jgi:glycine cleavage system H protein
MPGDLVFLMGNHPAVLPTDRRYCRNHMWCWPMGEGFRFGFTAYAVRLMQDVYFLDWHVGEGDALTQSQPIGHIETSKATSDLFAPIAGTILRFNRDLLTDPSSINLDAYGAGWLFDMQGEAGTTISAEEYQGFLAENWPKTQRMLKGQM